MTRGFIVLLKRGRIFKIVESYGDSYLSGLGVKVLELVEKNKLVEAFNCVQPIGQEIEGFKTDNAIYSVLEQELGQFNSLNYPISEFVASSKNEGTFFYDYSYIYDVDKDILKVYYYGKFVFKIQRENISLYKFIFENGNKLYPALTFNEKTYMKDKDYYKELKKVLKANPTIEDMQKIADKQPLLFIENYRTSDVWGGEAYQRKVKDITDKEIAKFIIAKEFGKYVLSIQLPFIRNQIFRGTSAASCEKELQKLVKEKSIELINFRKIYDIYNDYIKKMKSISIGQDENIDEISIVKEFYNNLDELTKENNYFRTLSFNCKNIKAEFKDNIWKLKRRALA